LTLNVASPAIAELGFVVLAVLVFYAGRKRFGTLRTSVFFAGSILWTGPLRERGQQIDYGRSTFRIVALETFVIVFLAALTTFIDYIAYSVLESQRLAWTTQKQGLNQGWRPREPSSWRYPLSSWFS